MNRILINLLTICLLAFLGATAAPAAQPLDVLLVLDNSGSMRKNDPQYLTRKAVADFTGKLPAESRVGMIIFDQKVRLAVPLTAVGAEAQKAIHKGLAGVDYHGQLTNTPAGVERAIYELKTNGRRDAAKIIVLMTDGIVETGNPNADADRTRWLREDLAGDAADNGIRLYGIAFTEEADLLLIQSLAKRTGAAYFRALEANELAGVFTKIEEALMAPPPAPPPPVVAEAPAPVVAPPPAAAPAPAPAPAAPAPAAAPKATTPAEGGELTPEERAALEQLAKDEGVPVEQLIKEMKGAKPGQAIIVRPEQGGTTGTEETRTGFVLIAVAGVLIVVAVFGAAWWLRRRGRAPKPAASASVTTTSVRGRSGPAIPEGRLLDVNQLTSEPPRKLGEKPVMIGRVAGTDTEHLDFYVIDKATVGRRHAVIKQKDGAYWLVDQGSVNGTFVNGERIVGERRLRHGDKLRFHKFEFEFSQPGADPGATMNASLIQGEPTVVADMAATIAATSATIATAATIAHAAAPARAPAPPEPDIDEFASTIERAAPAPVEEDPFGLTETVVPPVPPNLLDITDEHALDALERDKTDFFTDSGSHRPMHNIPPALAQDFEDDETVQPAIWHADDDRPLSVPPDLVDEEEDQERAPEEFAVDLDAGAEADEDATLLHHPEPIAAAAEPDFDAEASAFFDDVTVGPVVDIETAPRSQEDEFLLATTRGGAVPDEPEIFDPEFGKSTVVLPTSQHGDTTLLNPALAKNSFDDLSSTQVRAELEELPSEEGDVTLDDFMDTTSFDKSRLGASGGAEQGKGPSMQNFMSTAMFERKSADGSHQATAILVHPPTKPAIIDDVFDVTGAEGSTVFDDDRTQLPSELDDEDATRLMLDEDDSEERTRLRPPPKQPPKS